MLIIPGTSHYTNNLQIAFTFTPLKCKRACTDAVADTETSDKNTWDGKFWESKARPNHNLLTMHTIMHLSLASLGPFFVWGKLKLTKCAQASGETGVTHKGIDLSERILLLSCK